MCKLLSTADLQQMIGVTVERSAEIMDNGDPGCAYYTNPAAFSQLQKRRLGAGQAGLGKSFPKIPVLTQRAIARVTTSLSC